MMRKQAIVLCYPIILLLCWLLTSVAYGQEYAHHINNPFPQWKGTNKAGHQAKKIALHMQREKLGNVMSQLSEMYGVSIATGISSWPDKQVSLPEQQYTLEEALEKALAGTNLEPVILPNGDVVIRQQLAEVPVFSGQVQGRVTDARTGEPIAGVNILVRNQRAGTVTNSNGEYILELTQMHAQPELMFSYIGFQTEVRSLQSRPAGTWQLNIEMQEDITRLDEVVVTGTSVATIKKQVGSSISTLSSEDISHSGALAVDAALSGKVAGAYVSQNSGEAAAGISIRLRGIGSINGKSDPLIIVDGVIFNNDSPELIALQGTAQNRLADLNLQDIERIEIIKGAAAAATYGSRANNGVVQIFTKRGRASKPVFSFESKVLFNQLRKKIAYNEVPFTWEKVSDIKNTRTIPAERFDYQSHIFRPSVSTDQYLSLSGGTKETRYFLSGSYLHNNGIIENTDFSRLGARFRLDQMLNSWANLSVGGNYIQSKSREVPSSQGFGTLSGFMFADNSIHPRPNLSGVYPRTSVLANPLEVIDRYQFSQRVSRFVGDIQVNMTPLKGVTLQYLFGYDTYRQTANGFIPSGNTSNYPTGYSLNGNIQVGQLNTDFTASYQHHFSPLFSTTSILGATGQYQKTELLRIEADRLSPVIQTTDGGSILNRTDRRSEMSIWGSFFQQNISLAQRLFLTGAVRMDASSVFGKNERVQFYPKASLSYLLSEENFIPDAFHRYVDLLKIRAAWGQSGNLTGIGAYDRFTNYIPVPINGQTGLVTDTRLGNESLRPERQIEREAGIEISLLDNRLGLEATIYKKRVKDLLIFRELSPSSGYANRFENVGNLTNRGIELLIQGTPVKTASFTWKATATYSRNRNKVDGIRGERIIFGERGFGVATAYNGYPLGVFYGNPYARDEQGNIILDANGLPQRARDANGALINAVIGDPNPDYLASLINEWTYNRVHLRMQWDAVQGKDVFNFNRRILDNGSYGGGPAAGRELTGELPKGYGAAQFNILEEYVEDGSFVKLREVSLSYEFPAERWGMSHLRFSVIGRNLLSMDNYQGWDPEINYAGQSNVVRGFDFTTIPIPRTILASVSVSFK